MENNFRYVVLVLFAALVLFGMTGCGRSSVRVGDKRRYGTGAHNDLYGM